ncbi:hypothetical protein, partial [Undibacterium luofuense]
MQRARARIEQQLEKPGRHEVSLSHVPPGVLVQIDGSGSFYIAPEDIDPFQQETLDSVSRQAQQALQMAISEYEESRNLRSLLHAALYALLATLAYACLLWAVWKLRRIVMRRSLKFANAKLAELHDVGSALIQRERLHWLILKASQM